MADCSLITLKSAFADWSRESKVIPNKTFQERHVEIT